MGSGATNRWHWHFSSHKLAPALTAVYSCNRIYLGPVRASLRWGVKLTTALYGEISGRSVVRIWLSKIYINKDRLFKSLRLQNSRNALGDLVVIKDPRLTVKISYPQKSIVPESIGKGELQSVIWTQGSKGYFLLYKIGERFGPSRRRQQTFRGNKDWRCDRPQRFCYASTPCWYTELDR